ncbi:MAG: hypothetical protein FJX62_09315 [Alphaproteobacteria bacterium]|nr:hypothetical protein [Alphaproteobacteria bacterium]
MRSDSNRLPIAPVVALAAGLAVAGCTGISLPSFGTSSEPPPQPATPAALPSKYRPDDIVGRWGYAAFHREADRTRTVNAARGQCRNPYVIAKGPTGGVMMHLADQRQPTELKLKGGPGGRDYIGPDGDAGNPQDREILSFDGRVLVTRYVDNDAGNRYGNMVHVRCAPRA